MRSLDTWDIVLTERYDLRRFAGRNRSNRLWAESVS